MWALSETDKVTISRERLRRAMNALSYASIEAFDDASELLTAPDDDSFGELEGMLGLFFRELQDARALREAHARQQELIERQRMALDELSAPILDVWQGIIALPVIGVVDSRRAADMTEKLLARIIERAARFVIIDVTGVEVLDTQTADYFLKMVRAAGLLGSRCVLTGIRPELAQTLVAGGVELGGVVTVRSLREGIEACLTQIYRR
jgi:rsbT co-antagonist protein RsbR